MSFSEPTPLEKSEFPFGHGTCQEYILVLAYGKTEKYLVAIKIRMTASGYRKFENGEMLLKYHYAARLRDYWRNRGELIDLDFLITGGIEI